MFKHRKTRALAACLALLLSACDTGDGSGGWARESDDHGPIGVPEVTVVQDPSNYDNVQISWLPVTGAPIGYELQGSVDGGPFEKLHVGLMPPEQVWAAVDVSGAPELAMLRFRVRAMAIDAVGAWSATSEVFRSLRPPVGFWAVTGAASATLTWTTQSVSQTAWLLERRVLDAAGGTIEDWTELAVPFPADRFEDPLPATRSDGAVVSYQLRARAGAALSLPVTAALHPAPLLAPSDLASTPLQGSIALSWANRSAFATEVAVLRQAGTSYLEEEVALLPPSATTFLDEGLVTTTYRYRVVARRPAPPWGTLVSESPTIAAWPLLPTEWGPLAPSRLALPTGVGAVVRGGGWYAAAGLDGTSGPTAAFTPDGAAYARHDLIDGARLQWPGVLLDSIERPHLVYADGPNAWTTPVPIVHEWLEGGTWQREVIAERILSAGDGCQVVRAAIDAAGALHVVWMAGPSPASGLEYATNASGAWVIESVTAALPVELHLRFAQFKVAVADGEVHLLLDDWDTLYLAIRAGGLWTVEPVPVTGVRASYLDEWLALARAAGTTLVAYRAVDATNSLRLYAITRTGTPGAGSWGAPELLASEATYYALRAAASPSGRFAVAQNVGAPTVWVLDAGSWSSWRGFDSYEGDVAVGFRPDDGRLWFVDLTLAEWGDVLSTFNVYEEQ